MSDLSQLKIGVELPERQRQAMQFLANALSSLDQNGISVTKVVVTYSSYVIFTKNFKAPISIAK